MAYTYYNLTNITSSGNSTTVLTFVKGVNDIMNGAPAILMLLAIIIVIFLILIKQGVDTYRSMAATSWIALILCIILYPMGLISGFTLVLFAVLAPICIFLLWILGGTTYG